ncbi:VOC family protein [soil metagenome]
MSEERKAAFYPEVLLVDAGAGMDWLERTLGFERKEEHRDDDGNVVHAEMRLDGAVVMLASAGVGREPFASMPAGVAVTYCAIDRVEELHKRAQEAEVDIALELTETDYGSADFTVRDPEGNLWAFGTYRP